LGFISAAGGWPRDHGRVIAGSGTLGRQSQSNDHHSPPNGSAKTQRLRTTEAAERSHLDAAMAAIEVELEHAIGFSGGLPGALHVASEANYVNVLGSSAVINSFVSAHDQFFLRGHTDAISACRISPSVRRVPSAMARTCDRAGVPATYLRGRAWCSAGTTFGDGAARRRRCYCVGPAHCFAAVPFRGARRRRDGARVQRGRAGAAVGGGRGACSKALTSARLPHARSSPPIFPPPAPASASLLARCRTGWSSRGISPVGPSLQGRALTPTPRCP